MSKVSNIRKKALELVRKQEWPAAVKEYKRLAEMDQSNPNIFNELGDIYLKIGNKNDAYDSFEKAIDAYTRVSLHNNAVAVAKKVLRVLPARYEVLARLGHIRHRQGLAHEAESYYASFLKSLTAEKGADPKEVAKNCHEIAENVTGSTVMLEAVLECLDQHGLVDETGPVMVKLHPLYVAQGNQSAADQVKSKLAELGMADMVEPVRDTAPEGTVITEDTLWSESHSEGERVSVGADDERGPQGDAVQMGDDRSNANVYEYGEVEITEGAVTASGEGEAGESGETASQASHFESTPLDQPDAPPTASSAETTDTTDTAVATAEPESEDAGEVPPPPAGDAAAGETGGDAVSGPTEYVIDDSPAGPAEYVIDDETVPSAPDVPPAADAPPPSAPADAEVPTAPDTPSGPGPAAKARDDTGAPQVSAVMDAPEAPGDMTAEDFRSHYDLGMAYLEMELHADAIREFQLAARSPEFQLKCLEMIGQCFIAEGQPQLAIKQLTRGLHLITGDDRVALGIRYNLGVAYQMVGDAEAARSQFEDVYVVDVTFRDVGERLKALQ